MFAYICGKVFRIFQKSFARNMTYSRNLLDAIKQSEVKKVIVSGSCIEDYEGDLSAKDYPNNKKEIYTEYSEILARKKLVYAGQKFITAMVLAKRKALIPYLIDKIKKVSM